MKIKSDRRSMQAAASPTRIFADFIRKSGLKSTPQRNVIVKVFFKLDQHLTTEELYNKVCQDDDSIGQATVYRTLKLLCAAGLAREVHFGDGSARYEPVKDDSHHDHLICEICGRNIEVVDETIEELQSRLAASHGFKLTSHRMYLYGICAGCASEPA